MAEKLSTPENTPTVALNEAGMCVQRLHRRADAAAAAVRALLTQPDSADLRLAIASLVDGLSEEAFTVMNDINVAAERFGAQFTDTEHHATHRRFVDAVNAREASHG